MLNGLVTFALRVGVVTRISACDVGVGVGVFVGLALGVGVRDPVGEADGLTLALADALGVTVLETDGLGVGVVLTSVRIKKYHPRAKMAAITITVVTIFIGYENTTNAMKSELMRRIVLSPPPSRFFTLFSQHPK